MKPFYLGLGICLMLSFLACTKKDPKFLITETSVGPIQLSNSASNLNTLFPNDSIVQDTIQLRSDSGPKKIRIYEKGGQHLLTVTPNPDSIQGIANIKIEDSRYSTEGGISLESTFGEIQKAFAIKKIVTTLNSVVVFPKESNLYFTIDKEELPANLRYSRTDVEAVQIPEAARIKYLMIGR